MLEHFDAQAFRGNSKIGSAGERITLPAFVTMYGKEFSKDKAS